jgi:NADH-quinone oxidoreductase subunit J
MEQHISILTLFFYLFSTLAISSAVMVVLVNNPVYAVLFLILTFFNSAILVLLLNLEFLAIIFVIIYIGAIMVLFLFIVMMLDIKQSVFYLNFKYYFFISGVVLFILTNEFLYILSQDLLLAVSPDKFLNYTDWFSLTLESPAIKVLGTYLYTKFFFFFILAGLILLVSMIGAISLTLNESNSLGRQILYKQVYNDPKKSIFYVK